MCQKRLLHLDFLFSKLHYQRKRNLNLTYIYVEMNSILSLNGLMDCNVIEMSGEIFMDGNDF